MENKKLIAFICKANIHRSAIAEQVFKKIIEENNLEDKIEVISRGIKKSEQKNLTEYEGEWKASKPSLERLGIDVTLHIPKVLDADEAKRAMIIIAMDKLILSEFPNALKKQFPELADKMHLFSELEDKQENVTDPGGNYDEEFHREVIEKIYNTLKDHWQKIIEWSEKNEGIVREIKHGGNQ